MATFSLTKNIFLDILQDRVYDYMKYLFISLTVLIFLIWNSRKRPLPTESDLSHASIPWMHLYYASKYFTPVKKAPRRSGMEKHFRDNSAPADRTPLKGVKKVKLNAVGDIMIRTEISRGDHSVLWEEIGETLFGADLTFGNLEFAVNGNWPIDKTVRFSMTEEQADVMLGDSRYGRFDILSVANNHINDSLSEGTGATLDYLDRKGIIHTGGSRTPEEVDDFPIVEREGIRMAVLAYTFSTNGVPFEEGGDHGTNLVRFNALREKNYNPEIIYRQIELAKARGADIIIASLHWGIEFEYYPARRIMERGRDLLERGVDIIIGHHPHILNPSEWYRTKDGRDTLCFYSLNGVTSQTLPIPAQNTGEIARITLEKGTDKEGKEVTRIAGASLTPTFFLRSGKGEKSRHRILPLYETVKKIDEGENLPYLTGRTVRQIRKSHREYCRYFAQKAFRSEQE